MKKQILTLLTISSVSLLLVSCRNDNKDSYADNPRNIKTKKQIKQEDKEATKKATEEVDKYGGFGGKPHRETYNFANHMIQTEKFYNHYYEHKAIMNYANTRYTNLSKTQKKYNREQAIQAQKNIDLDKSDGSKP